LFWLPDWTCDYSFHSTRSPESLQMANVSVRRGGLVYNLSGKNDLSGFLKTGEMSFNVELESEYSYPVLAGSRLGSLVEKVTMRYSTNKKRGQFPLCIHTKQVQLGQWSISGLVMPTPSRKYGLVVRWKVMVVRRDAKGKVKCRLVVEPAKFARWLGRSSLLTQIVAQTVQDIHLKHSIGLIKTEAYSLTMASRLDVIGFNSDALDLNPEMLQSRSLNFSLEFAQKFGSCPLETYGLKVVYLMYKQVTITGLSVTLYVRNGSSFQFELPCEMLSLNASNVSHHEASMVFSAVMAPLIGATLWSYFFPRSDTIPEATQPDDEWRLLPLDDANETHLTIERAIYRNIDVTAPLSKVVRLNSNLRAGDYSFLPGFQATRLSTHDDVLVVNFTKNRKKYQLICPNGAGFDFANVI